MALPYRSSECHGAIVPLPPQSRQTWSPDAPQWGSIEPLDSVVLALTGFTRTPPRDADTRTPTLGSFFSRKGLKGRTGFEGGTMRDLDHLNDKQDTTKHLIQAMRNVAILTLVGLTIVLVTTLLCLLPFRFVVFLAVSFGLLFLWAIYETSHMDS